MYMIQSTEYVLAPNLISYFKKLDAAHAEALWTMYHSPKLCTLDMVRSVDFNPSSWRALRYYTYSSNEYMIVIIIYIL